VPEATSEQRLSKVFAFHRSLRFVSIVGKDGEPIATAGRPGLASLEPEEMTASIFSRAAIAWGMTERMNEFHGKIRTAIVIRERIVIVCFFTLGRMFLAFADPEFPIGETEGLGRLLDGLSIDITSPSQLVPDDGL